MIHYLKYHGQQQIGTFLGDWQGTILKEEGLDECIDMVVPVPLHKRKLRQRGYNQVAQYAQRLAWHLNATYTEQVLQKTANTKTQTKKGRWARWHDDRKLYILREPDLIAHKNVLLVDDVITTGATMEICARALQEAPGTRIYLTSMAVVP
ncbi:MAG: ComF family protein [Bacteroidota bacterium]